MAIKILIVGDLEFKHPKVIDWLLDPVRLYQSKIESYCDARLSIEDCKSFIDVEFAVNAYEPDILFYSCLWNTDVENLREFLHSLRSKYTSLKIIFFDHYDQSSSPFFTVLEEVDLYVKMMLYKNMSLYQEQLAGNYIVTDYMHKNNLIDLNGWQFGSSIAKNQEAKIIIGWNLFTMNSLSRYSRYPILKYRNIFTKKSNDIVCRLSVLEDDSYYTKHRTMCLEAVRDLSKNYSVIQNSDGSKVSFRKFNHEIRSSRIAISPFGWGEITDRDFRIINYGTMLVKPDMSHLNTVPNIYVNGETYAAVEWDFSNLADVCEYYLSHPKESREIVENAAEVLRKFFRNNAFVHRFGKIIDRVADIEKA